MLERTRLMALGVSAWSIATAATGAMRGFVQLLLARSFVGVGEAAYATISPAQCQNPKGAVAANQRNVAKRIHPFG